MLNGLSNILIPEAREEHRFNNVERTAGTVKQWKAE